MTRRDGDTAAAPARVVLIASSDDYLLEESLDAAVAEAAELLGGAEVERLPESATPEDVAVELRSPSLFAPARVLVVAEVRRWLDTTAPRGALGGGGDADVTPLVEVLADGAPDGTALVMGAWCGRQPKGPLVDAVAGAGVVQWVPLPDPPKPWEDVALSKDQWRVLAGLLARAAGEVRFSRDAERLLLERLGFDPRRLVQETRKLVAAAGEDRAVDEDLVRRLTFPRQRSLEVVRDGVLQRDPRPLLELVAVAATGITVNDWQGRPITADRLGSMLCGQVSNLLVEMLYLRRLAAAAGLVGDMDPGRTGDSSWYRAVFSKRLGPRLSELIGGDGPTPLHRKGKPPSNWALGQLFRGAGHYDDDELTAALAAVGEVELAQRGPVGLDALAAWVTRTMEQRVAAG